jgi:hypothetical protein
MRHRSRGRLQSRHLRLEVNGSQRRFPLPCEIADVPGAEGWRSMYPYYTRFQPEDDGRFWSTTVRFHLLVRPGRPRAVGAHDAE